MKIFICFCFQYMENEGERKLVEFIISVETFAEQLPQTESNEQAMEDAMIIYNRLGIFTHQWIRTEFYFCEKFGHSTSLAVQQKQLE